VNQNPRFFLKVENHPTLVYRVGHKQRERERERERHRERAGAQMLFDGSENFFWH
jgi:hypothetical protein